MSKKPAAKKVATASSKPTLAFASFNGKLENAPDSVKLLKESTLASFECKACKHTVIAQAQLEPFCVHCGSGEMVKKGEVKAEAALAAVSEKNLYAIKCKAGDHSLVLAAEDGKRTLSGHCLVCGTKNTVADLANQEAQDSFKVDDVSVDDKNPSKEEADPELVKMENAKAEKQTAEADCEEAKEDSDKETSSKRKIKADVDGFEDIDDVDGVNDFSDDAADLVEAPDDEDFVGGDEVVEFDEPANDVLEADEVLVDDTVISTAKPEDVTSIIDGLVETKAAYSEGTPLIDTLAMNDGHDDVELVTSAAKVFVVKDNVAIASIDEKQAGKNADVLRTKAFTAAFEKIAEEQGVRAAVKKLGFQNICVKSLSQASVDKQISEVKAAAKKKEDGYQAALRESLVLASIGLARGQWKGKQDPLVAKMTSVLKAYHADEAKARRLAAKACLEVGEDHVRALLELASNLVDKADLRTQLKATFQMTNATAAVDDTDVDLDEGGDLDDEADSQSDLTSRLEAGIYVDVEPVKVAASTVSDLLSKPLKFL
jgi:hypothetical protein